MKCLLLITSIAIASVSGSPVHVDELEDFVTSRDDKNQLERLDDNDQIIRYEKQRQLNAILARQPPNVQQQYSQAVQREQADEQRKSQLWQQQLQQRGFGDLAAQLHAIDNDMNISDAEAKMRKQQLKRQYYYSTSTGGLDYDDDMWSSR